MEWNEHSFCVITTTVKFNEAVINDALFAKPTNFLHYLSVFCYTLSFGLLSRSNLPKRQKNGCKVPGCQELDI